MVILQPPYSVILDRTLYMAVHRPDQEKEDFAKAIIHFKEDMKIMNDDGRSREVNRAIRSIPNVLIWQSH